jgi:hypothetical protein
VISSFTSQFVSSARQALLVAGLLLTGTVALAQALPEPYRELNNNLANNAVSAVEVFSAGKIVATGNFTYDNPDTPDVTFSTFKLPGSYQFSDATNSVRLFVEGYLGYFKLDQDLNETDPTWGSLDVQSGTATLGVGVGCDLNDWLTITPRMQFAYSHVELHLRGNPPPPINSIIASWGADALTLLPSLDLIAHRRLGLWDVAFNTRYTYIRSLGLHDTSSLISIDSETHLWRNEISTRFHTPRKTLGLPLDYGALFARHDLTGQLRQSGFVSYFYEARLTIFSPLPKKLRPLTGAALTGATYFNGPLSGYSIGVSLDF